MICSMIWEPIDYSYLLKKVYYYAPDIIKNIRGVFLITAKVFLNSVLYQA